MRTLRQNINESLFRDTNEKPWEATDRIFGENTRDPIKIVHAEKGKFVVLYPTQMDKYYTYIESSDIPALQRFCAIQNTNNVIIAKNSHHFGADNTIFDGCGINFYIPGTVYFNENLKAIKNTNITLLDSSFKYYNGYMKVMDDYNLPIKKSSRDYYVVVRSSIFRPLIENFFIKNFKQFDLWFNKRNTYFPIMKNSIIDVKILHIDSNNVLDKIRKNTPTNKVKEMFKSIGFNSDSIKCNIIKIKQTRIISPFDFSVIS